MIIIRVELWSAVAGKVTELARMGIDNIGVNGALRDYNVRTWRGRSKASLDKSMQSDIVTRKGKVLKHPAEAVHIWYLIGKALAATGYGDATKAGKEKG